MTSVLQFVFAVAAVCAVSLSHTQAEAYLNPGTGSMILQALIAGLAVIAVTVKIYWYKFIAFLKGERYEPEEDLLADLEPEPEEFRD